MEKYTVDLDQVLNDFEYAEFTDQHSRNVSQQPQANIPPQYRPTPITKHSITNVFDSLNEYLSSDVNSGLLTDVAGKSTEFNDNNLDYLQLQLNKSEDSQREPEEPKDFNLNGNTSVPVENHSLDNVERLDEVEPLETITDNSKWESEEFEKISPEITVLTLDSESKDENSPSNSYTNPTCEIKAEESSLIGIKNLKEDSEVLTENCDKIIESIIPSIEDNEAVLVEVEDGIVENESLEEDRDSVQLPLAQEEINEPNIIDPDVTEEYLSTEEDVDACENNASSKQDYEETNENKSNVSENINGLSSNEIEEPKEVSVNVEPSPKVIGFSSDIEIDESELNKMLEDLEIEEIEDSQRNNETDQPNLEKVSESVAEVEDKNIAQIADVNINEAISKDSDIRSPVQKEIVECLEVEKPKRNKESSKKSLEKSGKETPPVESKDQIGEKQSIEKDVQYEQPKESLSRPQNLPLNNQVENDVGGRKINLIGSPGSTPYNNVYLNKTIEPKETESDYTSSASPTFSDCSTESSSTASTVSVEDKPNNSDKIKRTNEEIMEKNLEFQEENNRNHAEEHLEDEACAVEGMSSESSQQEEATGASGDSQMQNARQSSETFLDKSWLGKEAPLWIPDADASACLHCDMKFTVIKRRHHCRACGLVLCSKCCNMKFKLEYLDAEARVCNKCYTILNNEIPNNAGSNLNSPDSGNSPAFRPNPNNPLEYCSMVSPLEQAGQAGAPPPSVMVPVGVLKRKGSNKKSNKSVMFCDGIAPGSDLTNLDSDFNYSSGKQLKNLTLDGGKKEEKSHQASSSTKPLKINRNLPKIDEETGCFIPKSDNNLPPTICINKTDVLYSDCSNSTSVVEMLKNETLIFAINQNLFVRVKIINMSCCINKHAWCFSSEGLINVGSDEVIYLIEHIEDEDCVPKDVFFHIYNVYLDALKGNTVKELGISLHNTSDFLDSRNHAGFVYIRPTYQCLDQVLLPDEPYLIGILIHRWETPWAKLFPLRLILRLGAEYRYYPSPLISTRHRDSVFVEIGHTIISLLADFRNFSYTLPQIRGLIIHMEDKKTTISIPANRYDQVMKSINNSSDHILAFAGNFSPEADSHLVCIQDTEGHENLYTTHAINIHNKPRKVTGASFIVFNGSLKMSSGLTAKSNIVEDGLMIQIPSEHMEKIRDNLKNMKNHTISCGCIDAASDETVNIVWGENDIDFNAGVKSPIDRSDMKGVPSIRVHNGKDYCKKNGTRLIRWTEVFILQNADENSRNPDPVDISKMSESIAEACCTALIEYLDLLVSNSCQKIGIRTTLHVENVSYSAGSNGLKLTPIYMRSLDNELIPVLHRITSNNLGDNAIVLELIFRILNI
ncbi:hypothetical protein ABEB36_006654 [Hypothenemus hampei]|uniref:FYVE-type domain-containing protein n=1 Tax=Hypothenemus hampei TaxID=57062 RepID=A0ABD1ERB2_HYPHA